MTTLALCLLLLQNDGAKAFQEGRYADAAAYYEKNPSPANHAMLGHCRLQLKDWDGAVRAFTAALTPEAGADVHRGLGRAHYMAGRYAEAVASLRRARRLEPEFGDGLWIARALAQGGWWAAAEVEAASTAGDDATELMAWLLGKRGRHAEAAERYRTLAARTPKHWVSAGQAEAAAGREGAAIDALETARRLGHLDAPGLRLLGDLCLRGKLYREAAEAYGAVGSPTAEDLSRLGHARLQAGEPASARAAFEKALALDPARADAALQLGRMATEPAEARKRFAEAMKADPASTAACAALGELELRAGDPAAAAAAFAEVLRRGDRSAAAHCSLALALKQAGRDELPALRDGLREHPLDERLRALLRAK